MMKAIKIALPLMLAVFLLTACGNSNAGKESAAGDGRISVVTTIFPPYDFVREIAGETVKLDMLLPPGAESHSFEPTPQDIIKIQNCDLFIYTGGESDEWVNEILESMDTSKMRVLKMMDCVNAVEEEIVEGMEDTESDAAGASQTEAQSSEPSEYDEHVWTAPKNAELIVNAISDVLCEIDDVNASNYRANEASYIKQLEELDADFREITEQAVRKTVIFADRFPFRYFADAYGLDYYAAFPGCSTETEPSAATVAFLIDKVKNEKIPVVFYTEFSNQRMADSICEETGAKKLLLHACHNIAKTDFQNGESYISLMKINEEHLREALS